MLASLSGALTQRALVPPPTAGAGVVTYGWSYHWNGLSTVMVSARLLYRLRKNEPWTSPFLKR